MADKTNQRGLKDLLENVYEVHRKDIKTFTSGHLNPSKLLKPEENRHARWRTSDKPPVRLKPPSHPVNLPVRKGEVTHQERQERKQYNTILEFSLGPIGTSAAAASSEKKEDIISEVRSPNTTPRRGTEKLAAFQHTHVEELKLPEIMLPVSTAQTRKGLHHRSKSDSVSRQQFINTYLAHPTKADQFASFKEFGDRVLNLGDAHDRGVLTGAKTIRNLERRLGKQLAALDTASQKGPNFHRLQLYTRCFQELISESETFGPLLQEIKDAYDSYVSHLLDSQKPSQHRVLYQHMESLSQDLSTSEQLKREQERVRDLEKKAKQMLEENERLRKIQQEEGEMAQEIPQGSASDRQKAFVHVEEIPKDLEEQVEDLHVQILTQLDAIDEIKRHQKEEYVPVSVCHHLEQCIKETEVDIQKLLKQNEFLEQTIQELGEELESLLAQSGTSEKKARKLWKKVNKLDVIELGKRLAEEKRRTLQDL